MEKFGEIMKSCNNCVNKGICSEGWFYDCHKEDKYSHWSPIEQEFKLKPLAEILEEESCQKVGIDSLEHPVNQELLPELDAFKLIINNLAIFKQIQNKSHLCHYTKFQLDFDINASIRFIHAFDDRPELVGKFIYKHHEEKLFSVIEPQLAEHFIKTQCSNEAEEFINRYVGQGKKKQYRRIKVTENSLTKYFES